MRRLNNFITFNPVSHDRQRERERKHYRNLHSQTGMRAANQTSVEQCVCQDFQGKTSPGIRYPSSRRHQQRSAQAAEGDLPSRTRRNRRNDGCCLARDLLPPLACACKERQTDRGKNRLVILAITLPPSLLSLSLSRLSVCLSGIDFQG